MHVWLCDQCGHVERDEGGDFAVEDGTNCLHDPTPVEVIPKAVADELAHAMSQLAHPNRRIRATAADAHNMAAFAGHALAHYEEQLAARDQQNEDDQGDNEVERFDFH